MFCYFCQKSKKTNPFASAEGCTNLRTSTLQRHKDCKEHEDAVNEEAISDTFSNTQRRVFRTLNKTRKKSVDTNNLTCYCLITFPVLIVKGSGKKKNVFVGLPV